MPRPQRPLIGAIVAAALLVVGLSGCGSSGSAQTDSTAAVRSETSAGTAPGIASVPVQVVRTADGKVAYRQLGKGTPLLLITGLGASIDGWEPSFVDALASHHRIIVFDNAGVGQTTGLPSLTVSAMAEQTSAFISALGLGRVDVLGWSMGGTIAQALAVMHPAQVGRLVLAATQAGTGRALAVPAAAAAAAMSADPAVVLSILFPPDQAAARQKYVTGLLAYPGYYGAPRDVLASQNSAVQAWIDGKEHAGHLIGTIRVPTLVADGTVDALNPVANDRLLADTIRGARLVLYPGAGHGFLFQDADAFVPRLEKFLR